jgi:hypothetical protein
MKRNAVISEREQIMYLEKKCLYFITQHVRKIVIILTD